MGAAGREGGVLGGGVAVRAVPLGVVRADVVAASESEVAARKEVHGGTEMCAFVGEQEIATLVPTG